VAHRHRFKQPEKRRPWGRGRRLPAGLALGLLLLLVGPDGEARERVGSTAPVLIESPHPYPEGDGSRPVVWTHTLRHPGATFLKLHVADLELGRGDTVHLLDGAGSLVAAYSDRQNSRPRFWAPSAAGDTVTIELRAGDSGAGRGVTIDRYGYGSVPLAPESTCGPDDKEDVACYAGTPIEASSRPVGRMVFEDHGDLFACTGFLISPRDQFLTAAHCIRTQASVDSLEVRFNYQREGCGGKLIAPFETYVGGRLLLVHTDGSRSDFIFSNVRTNTGLKAPMFSFKVPPGVEVVDGLGQ
jgi:hypothetical protein